MPGVIFTEIAGRNRKGIVGRNRATATVLGALGGPSRPQAAFYA
jgi:hypothetical protein